MVKALFDTNILIDYLRGIPPARDELHHYDQTAISVISWMEVLVGATSATESGTRMFLDRFTLLVIDDEVAGRAVALRRTYRLKLPDAVVWASAQVHSMLLVTRDAKAFPVGDPGIRMPYPL
jgi:predicted nucleic acid-binding protein